MAATRDSTCGTFAAQAPLQLNAVESGHIQVAAGSRSNRLDDREFWPREPRVARIPRKEREIRASSGGRRRHP
jgi:hypothetical protein